MESLNKYIQEKLVVNKDSELITGKYKTSEAIRNCGSNTYSINTGKIFDEDTLYKKFKNIPDSSGITMHDIVDEIFGDVNFSKENGVEFIYNDNDIKRNSLELFDSCLTKDGKILKKAFGSRTELTHGYMVSGAMFEPNQENIEYWIGPFKIYSISFIKRVKGIKQHTR